MDYRIYDKSVKPDESVIVERIGTEGWKIWQAVTGFIDENYPGVFTFDDWLYGKKYGWYLRFKKSKSYCTLYPAENSVVIQIVFGKAERDKAESLLDELHPLLREAYEEAETYHDGKWLFIELNNEILEDIKRLLTVKRKPKPLK